MSRMSITSCTYGIQTVSSDRSFAYDRP
jgi:hypothetical protein